jgi:hypothetical protein
MQADDEVSEKPATSAFNPKACSPKKNPSSTTGTVTALRITTDLPRCWTIHMLFCTNSIYSTLGVHRTPHPPKKTWKPPQNSWRWKGAKTIFRLRTHRHKIYSPGSGRQGFGHPCSTKQNLTKTNTDTCF